MSRTGGKMNLNLIVEQINKYFDERNAALTEEGRFPRLTLQDKLRTHMLTFVEYVAKQHDENQKRGTMKLDLSDKRISMYTGLPENRVKQIRGILRKIGVIWFPEYSRQKKKGDYPIWMIASKFINWKKDRKKKRQQRKDKYVDLYYELLNQKRTELWKDLKESGSSIETKDFIVLSYVNLNDHLKKYGLVKEHFLRGLDNGVEDHYYNLRFSEIERAENLRKRLRERAEQAIN